MTYQNSAVAVREISKAIEYLKKEEGFKCVFIGYGETLSKFMGTKHMMSINNVEDESPTELMTTLLSILLIDSQHKKGGKNKRDTLDGIRKFFELVSDKAEDGWDTIIGMLEYLEKEKHQHN